MKTIKSLLCVAIIAFASVPVAHCESWLPVKPAELAMTSEPKAPGAPAIILELQYDRDDQFGVLNVYQRIKVLTEEGRKYANVEIAYDKYNESVHGIEARTISPDGKVTEFRGEIFDKLIVKGKGIHYQAKLFTLPDVRVGSIVEYRFEQYISGWANDSRWILSGELFIKHAKYSLKHASYGLRWSWPHGLPAGATKPESNHGRIQMETFDVPAFIEEDYMPPTIELKHRVDFVYNMYRIKETEPDKFWNELAKIWYEHSNEFMDKRRAMEKVVAGLVGSADSAEIKMRKIYSHVQQLRNLSFERNTTLQEAKREKLKENGDVAAVETNRYGDAAELTFLYVALARAAGLKADIGLVSTRDKYFFEQGFMNTTQLTSFIAVVSDGDKQFYLEPGIPFVPFGMLPWYETGVPVLLIEKQNGQWIKSPYSTPSQSKTSRVASLKIEDGALVGNVVVTYTGINAINHRLEEMHDDMAGRKEYMEDELKRVIQTGAEVTLTNTPDWEGVETPLVVQYKIKIPGWVSQAGNRLLLPIGVFGNEEKHTFERETRIHPIYFHYANAVDDEINIALPENWQAASVPDSHDENISVTTFSSAVVSKATTVLIKRNLSINNVYMPEKYYLALHEFYQALRVSDEEQIVLTPVATATTKPVAKTH